MGVKLKKSYKGFVIWLVGYMVALMSLSFLPAEDGALLVRLMMNMTTAALAILAYVIYRTEQIYWYNGVEYEEAVQAGSERRKEYARRHFTRFANTAGLYLAYTLVSCLLNLHFGVDIAVACVAITAAALSTIRIKL